MELFLDVLSETLVDTAKMLPFLFLAYLFIEYVETRHGERIETLLAGGGRWGAVPGAVLGCVPQCGFSAIASNFYASRVITLGTLMAVYLSTSDEAIPLLVSMPAYWDKLILLMVIKVVYAVFVGFLLDFVLRKALPRSLRGGYTGHADEVDCHEEHSDEERAIPSPSGRPRSATPSRSLSLSSCSASCSASSSSASARMSSPRCWAGWASSSRWWPHWWASSPTVPPAS